MGKDQTIKIGDIVYKTSSNVFRVIDYNNWASSLGNPIGVVALAPEDTPDGITRIASLRWASNSSAYNGSNLCNFCQYSDDSYWDFDLGEEVTKLTFPEYDIPYITNSSAALMDFDGKQHTINILAVKPTLNYPSSANTAVKSIQEYSESAAPEISWYIPALGEATSLYKSTERSILINALTVLKNYNSSIQPLNYAVNFNGNYSGASWTSTGYDAGGGPYQRYMWIAFGSYGIPSQSHMVSTYGLRPFTRMLFNNVNGKLVGELV